MENGFASYHPYVQFFYYVCVGLLVLNFNHPLFLVVGLLLLVLVNLSHDRGKALKKWSLPLLMMSGFMIVLNPFLVSRGTNILFYFRGKQVTLEATVYGVTMALFIVSIIVMFVSFNIILNGNRFLFIFARILPKTAFLIMLSIRFVPLLKSRLDQINAVQRVRGMSITAGSLRERARNGLLRIQILLTWSLEEAVQTADSMQARGYGSGKKSSYIPYKMERRDWTWFSLLIFLFVISIAGGYLGYGKIVVYPVLGTLHLFLIDWVLFICMIIIFSFPLLVEGSEWLKWRFSK